MPIYVCPSDNRNRSFNVTSPTRISLKGTVISKPPAAKDLFNNSFINKYLNVCYQLDIYGVFEMAHYIKLFVFIFTGHTRQGLRCRMCKMNVHPDCQEKVDKCQPKTRLLRRQRSTSELETKLSQMADTQQEGEDTADSSGPPAITTTPKTTSSKGSPGSNKITIKYTKITSYTYNVSRIMLNYKF